MKTIHVLPLLFLSSLALGQTLKERSKPISVDFSDKKPIIEERKPIIEEKKIVAEEKPVVIETPKVAEVTKPTVDNRVITEEVKPAPVEAAVGAPKLGEEYTMAIPKYTALIIGVSNYKYSGQGLPSLENPVKDAQKLYDVLMTQYAFDTTHSKFLKDPTRQQIIDELEYLSSEMTNRDNLLVFYAGHGYYDKIKEFGYWLPSDAKASTRGEWIPNSTIKDYLATIPSKHTILITDACFGGSIFKTRAVDAATFLKIHNMYRDPSKKAITSGNLTEVPDKSIFISQLLKKLTENEDDYLPSAALYNRIYEPITNNSTATPQFGVIQGAGDEGGDFIFIKKPKK